MSRSASRKHIRIVRAVPKLPARRRDTHKGDYGRVLVVGGSRGMIGAPALTANAALRSGAGLVTIACPESIQQAVAVLCPCATTIPLPEARDGRIDVARAMKAIDASGVSGAPARPDALAAGPGLSRGNAAWDRAWRGLLHTFSAERHVPVVIDADGLNALAAADIEAGTWRTAPTGAVLTPHPGEMARLCGIDTNEVQRRREELAVRLSRSAGANGEVVTLLKGAGTIVTDGTRLYRNTTGNPGMATGGTGDVLTGIIAALIGQGLARFEAAVLGAHLHGLAGDLAAREKTQTSMTALDVLAHLPQAIMTHQKSRAVSPARRRRA